MNAIIPLLFTLILINHKKLKNDKYYRNSVFAIVGITFFCLLKFTDYYFSIFPHSNFARNIIDGSVITITVLLCLSPLIVKSGPMGAGISITLFSLSALLALGLDYQVKNFIAEKGGYFNQTPPQTPKKSPYRTKKYISDEGGFRIQLQDKWEKKRHKSEQDYFVLNELDSKIAELRPICFHTSKNVITDIVNNFRKSALIEKTSISHYCYKKNEFFVCLIKNIWENNNSPLERWHWIAMNPHYQQNIELDVLIYKQDAEIKEEINRIINSVEIGSLPDPTPICSGTIDWF